MLIFYHHHRWTSGTVFFFHGWSLFQKSLFSILPINPSPAGIYLFKVNNENTRTMWHRSGLFIVNFEQISHIVLVFIVDFNQINTGWVIALKIKTCRRKFSKISLLKKNSTSFPRSNNEIPRSVIKSLEVKSMTQLKFNITLCDLMWCNEWCSVISHYVICNVKQFRHNSKT